MLNQPKLRKHKKTYYIIFYNPQAKKQKWHSLKTDDKQVANRRFHKVWAETEQGLFNPFDDKIKEKSLSFREAIQVFLDSRKHLKPKTQTDTKEWLTTIANLLPEGINIVDVTSQKLSDIIYRPKLSPYTQKGYWARLNTFYGFLVTERILPTNIIQSIVKPKVPKKLPEYLKREEIEILTEHLKKQEHWLHDLVWFAVSTGMRLNEILHLQVQHIDDNFIHVRNTADFSTKTDEDRSVPISEISKAIYLKHKKNRNQGTLFLDASNEPIKAETVSHTFRIKIDETDIVDKKRYSFHSLRHTFASWLIQDGTPIEFVSQWLGHSNLQTTQIYAHLAPTSGQQFLVAMFRTTK